MAPSSPDSRQQQQQQQHPAKDLFAFGAFDGLHTYEGSYYLQICALVRCANQSRQSCGSPADQSSTLFRSLTMWADMQTEFVYPEVLLTTSHHQLRLAEAEEWSFHEGVIRSKGGFSYPLLASSLFGRWYARDTKGLASPRHDDQDARDGGVVVVSVERWAVVAWAVAVAWWFAHGA
ncbi:vascular non-inflammatory molecule 3-like [Babylonia areolata]|uniref:vascular non-inflammatory molecule 3-like n=1 Tax=Babylonia areolata TaxID=304850 RepID=UPI003FD41EC7